MSVLCAICGIRPATTRDHVPPKSLFVKPYPQDFITVPACDLCNNGSSVVDEDFRTYLSMTIGQKTDAAKKLWMQAKKSLKRRKSTRQAIIESIDNLDLTIQTEDGEKKAVSFPYSIYVPVFERVIRGLYYHHFDEILGEASKFQLNILKNLTI